MDKVDAQYLFLLDFCDYIKGGKGKEILSDLKNFFPTEYERLLKDIRLSENNKELAVLLRASSM